jgi:hypothetical protein
MRKKKVQLKLSEQVKQFLSDLQAKGDQETLKQFEEAIARIAANPEEMGARIHEEWNPQLEADLGLLDEGQPLLDIGSYGNGPFEGSDYEFSFEGVSLELHGMSKGEDQLPRPWRQLYYGKLEFRDGRFVLELADDESRIYTFEAQGVSTWADLE